MAFIKTFRTVYNLFRFAEVRILSLLHNDIICYYWAFKLAYFVERNISYQVSTFQPSRIPGSNFTEGDGKQPCPQCFVGTKKPSAFRVNPFIHGLMREGRGEAQVRTPKTYLSSHNV